MDQLQVFKTEGTKLPTDYVGGYKLHNRRCSAIEQRDIRRKTEGRNVTAAKLGFGQAQTFLGPRRYSYSSASQKYSESVQLPATPRLKRKQKMRKRGDDRVKVAVRVRPFNDRERARNAKVIIGMVGNTTSIKDPDGKYPEKKYTFDFSYWSHDSFNSQEDGYLVPNGKNSRYADQTKVFDDLGRGVLENAWKGFNCSLFAYGQTGSGKSYSMVGYNANKGIIPVACEELFKSINDKNGKDDEGKEAEYQVSLSMLEIYNEVVKDLLNPQSFKKGGLKVREHPQKGFYVEELQVSPVSSYPAIEAKIAEGTRNRTLAATNMNATSSRAHTIVAINFTQKTLNESGKSMTKISVINLVDLAGSERADSTGATGERLKEGSMINKSLLCLGNCIKALADLQEGKNINVPFRDSMLTRLLKNALGGNSKTIMIAALSPADINYDETLSTLRFADRAKNIKTKAVVNESPTDKMIREMKGEIQRLQDLLQNQEAGTVVVKGISQDEVEEMKKAQQAELRKNQEEVERMKQDWQQQLEEQKKIAEDKEKEVNAQKEAQKTNAHLWNLNEDPMLTKMIIHITPPGTIRIGSSPPAEVILRGLGINKEHAVIENEGNNKILIYPVDNSQLLINGKIITSKCKLHHNDRIVFGSNQLYVFNHPTNAVKQENANTIMENITFEFAQEEIAEYRGFDMNKSGKTSEDMILQDDLVQIMPMVSEANAMSEELDRKMMYEVTLLSAHGRGLKEGKTEVCVKATNLVTNSTYVWSRNEFVNRKYAMQEAYQAYMDEDDWLSKCGRGYPFAADEKQESLIGTAFLYLQSLSYLMDIDEHIFVRSHTGKEAGMLEVSVIPFKDGKILTDDLIEDPHELVGKNYQFQIDIKTMSNVPKNYIKVWCRYKFLLEDAVNECHKVTVDRITPLNFKRTFNLFPVSEKILNELEQSPVMIQVWGVQSGHADPDLAELSTAELVQALKETKVDRRSGSSAKIQESKNEAKEKAESELNHLKKVMDNSKKLKEETEKENLRLQAEYRKSMSALEEVQVAHEKSLERLKSMETKMTMIDGLVKLAQRRTTDNFAKRLERISVGEGLSPEEFDKLMSEQKKADVELVRKEKTMPVDEQLIKPTAVPNRLMESSNRKESRKESLMSNATYYTAKTTLSAPVGRSRACIIL